MKNLYKIQDELYIVSDKEKSSYCIKECPMAGLNIDRCDCQIFTACSNKVGNIILTTNKSLIKDGVQAINDEFLEWFVKNPSCEWVEVISLRKSSGYYDEKEIWHWDFLAYKIIIPKEESKTMFESLQEYLKNTPKEKVLEDWNEFQHLDDEGITVEEFLENQKQETFVNEKCFKCGRNQYSSRKPFCTDDFCNKDFYQKPKQETVEEAAEKFYPPKTTDLICSPKLVRNSFIAGAKWQQEPEQFFNDDRVKTLEKSIEYLLKKQERMYSEEEVEEIVSKLMHEVHCGDIVDTEYVIDFNLSPRKWFEQNKKK